MSQSTSVIGAAAVFAAALGSLAALGTLAAGEARAAGPTDVRPWVDATPWVDAAPSVGACLLTPEVVRLSGTQSAPGSRGSMTLTQPGSPFEITVDEGGFQTFDIEIQVEQMRKRRGAVYVAWAAKPELDEWVRLGTLGEDNRLAGRVAWNQFLIFVSEEASADVERWQGPIMLTGLSPSGRLHTMAGHGPFEAMNCQLYF
ncbi:hypothetical protein [Candidatus Palauibacter sp.]|uniref:hypothetical protein n=1 Tax=Candidatus Palauibacter sp. TaxID=3101350 RepID=UPI003B0247B9